MDRFDYDFTIFQEQVNSQARKIISESYGQEFNAQDVSDQIDEAQVTYNKIQKILNCPEMIKSHAYLYALDMENVDECDKKKIDDLYALGEARGVIPKDEPEKNEGDENLEECGDVDGDGDDEICGGPDDALTGQEMTPGEQKPAMQSASFTVLYSAMKDGQVKTGEYFSSATDTDAARQDCISNLTPLGYSSIRVLGIEQTNNAVDDTSMYIDEDDSKEYEEQETGSGEVQANNPDEGKEKQSDGQESSDGGENKEQSADEGSSENKDDSEEKKDQPDKDSDEQNKENSEENKEEGEKTSDDSGDSGEEKKKLTPTEKQVLRDEYVGMFKAELQKTQLEKSVNEMSIKERADFWGTIAKKWEKQDPEEFMTSSEIKKLYDTVIKN